MKLENITFMPENLKKITVKAIEDYILNAGYQPLRWAIVRVENNKPTVEATCIRE